jgi:branched-chain amino acid transport system ATP-binding protein
MMLPNSGDALLNVESVSAGYGHVAVLNGVSLSVRENQICTVVGSNGAGKSTLLKTISGLLKPTSGSIVFNQQDIGGQTPRQIVKSGLLHVAEGRRVFRTQTVASNLELGFFHLRYTADEERCKLDEMYAMFPILHERCNDLAGALSGGQQQMLAIAQALISSPRLLMLDEPSLGLAPVVVEQILETIVRLRASGCAILLVEQLVDRALEIADTACVMRNGDVLYYGGVEELQASDVLDRAYMAG